MRPISDPVIKHHDGCNPDYPEKDPNEKPRHQQAMKKPVKKKPVVSAYAYGKLKAQLRRCERLLDDTSMRVYTLETENERMKQEFHETYTDERDCVWFRPTAEAYAKACAALNRHRALAELGLQNLRALWTALRMIRECVELHASPGSVMFDEQCGAEPHEEADAIIAGILAIVRVGNASAPSSD